jgi:hypothetical protein
VPVSGPAARRARFVDDLDRRVAEAYLGPTRMPPLVQVDVHLNRRFIEEKGTDSA